MEYPEQLEWQDGQPVSRHFGDVYFSRAGGLDEVRHVFLRGNRLPERFAGLPGGARFVIGETGFGTGLNFLGAWQLFEALAPASAQLDFVSTELYPLSPAEMQRALALWPELAPLTDCLLAQYGALAPGWHRFDFAPRRVRLTLLIGDARATLPALNGVVDAWFLDGFSPARNPQLWEPALLHAIGMHSRAGATVATYSCAGAVRRALAAAGFDVRKTRGFGSKREMLTGEFRAAARAGVRMQPTRAAVIGAGLAGCAVASSLARRGWQVTLLERGAGVATEASGNPQGVLYARLSAHGTALSEVVLSGYQHSLRLLRRMLPSDGLAWSDAPVLQLAFDPREAQRQQALLQRNWPHPLLHAVDVQQASDIAGMTLPAGGVLFPSGGWVHPPALCQALAAAEGVELRTGASVSQLRHGNAGWEAWDGAHRLLHADVVVIANSGCARELAQTAHLPLHWNRGQVTLLPARSDVALHAVICGERYVAPARAGWHTTGATFERSASSEVRAADNVENLQALQRLAPALHAALDVQHLDAAGLPARAALRCVSPDYLPLAGAVANMDGSPLSGLFLTSAHGSRGLITAPLAGELLADMIDATPALLPTHLVKALDPGRFPTSAGPAQSFPSP